jgi:hypothetical protein
MINIGTDQVKRLKREKIESFQNIFTFLMRRLVIVNVLKVMNSDKWPRMFGGSRSAREVGK